MNIKTTIKYEESYLPPRCRKLRYKECEEVVNAELEEVNPSDLQLAFEDNSYSGKGKIFYYDNELWYKKEEPNKMFAKEHGYTTALEELMWINLHSSKFYFYAYERENRNVDTSREGVLSYLNDYMSQFILVDNELYTKTTEPRYCITTFGLGHNHGGTRMFCDYFYNENISKDNYFSALDGEKAVAYANQVASARGDTNDIGKFESFIKVHMPELVHCNPSIEHNDGCDLLNTFESIIQSSNTANIYKRRKNYV